MTKICSNCQVERPIEDFAIRKRSKDGRYYYCKECDRKRAADWRSRCGDVHRAGSAKWRLDNPERHKEMNLEWRLKNADKLKVSKKTYYLEHFERVAEKKKEWSKKNRDWIVERNRVWALKNSDKVKEYRKKTKFNRMEKSRSEAMARKASKLNATPKWLTKDQLIFMDVTYAMARQMEKAIGIKFHVDHIHPLISKEVCGLHVPWNLRVIPAVENMSKGNKLAA